MRLPYKNKEDFQHNFNCHSVATNTLSLPIINNLPQPKSFEDFHRFPFLIWIEAVWSSSSFFLSPLHFHVFCLLYSDKTRRMNEKRSRKKCGPEPRTSLQEKEKNMRMCDSFLLENIQTFHEKKKSNASSGGKLVVRMICYRLLSDVDCIIQCESNSC